MSLFQEFPIASEIEWKDQILKDLKGLPFESLFSTTPGGIERKPFYVSQNLNYAKSFLHKDWDILEYLPTSTQNVNKVLLEALNAGASGFLVDLTLQSDVSKILDKVQSNYINSNFRLIEIEENIVYALSNYFSGYPKDTVWNASISMDFISRLIESGSWFKNEEFDKNLFLKSVSIFSKYKGIRPVVIEGSIYQNSGVNVFTELGMILSHANFYLEFLLENGCDKKEIANYFQFNFSVGTDFFLEIAKLRAFQKLWKFLLSAYQIEGEAYISTCPTLLDKTSLDPYNNLLRITTQSMAAVIGGSRSHISIPFDFCYSDPNDFSRRISRNQQLIFKEEAYLNKIMDIGYGSYYLEELTTEIESKSYEFFQGIESKGGILVATSDGSVSQAILSQSKELIKQYESGKKILIGVNKFQNPSDKKSQAISRKIYPVTELKGRGLNYINLESCLISD